MCTRNRLSQKINITIFFVVAAVIGLAVVVPAEAAYVAVSEYTLTPTVNVGQPTSFTLQYGLVKDGYPYITEYISSLNVTFNSGDGQSQSFAVPITNANSVNGSVTDSFTYSTPGLYSPSVSGTAQIYWVEQLQSCGFTGCYYYYPTGYWTDNFTTGTQINVVPLPAAAWLFGSGLLGLIGIARRQKTPA